MQFSKKDDQWYIPTHYNAKVKEYSMNRILGDLIEMTGKVRSTDPKHQEMFKITDQQGLHVLLKDETEKPLANLIIGKKGEDYGSGFVRFAGKDKIYGTDKNILSSFSITGEVDTLSKFNQKTFVDLNAVKFDKKDLVQIAITSEGKQRLIKKIEKVEQPKEGENAEADTTKEKKKEFIWVLESKGKQIELDQKEVDKFIRDVSSVYAEEVVDAMAGQDGGDLLSMLTGGGGDANKAQKYNFKQGSPFLAFWKENDETQYNVIFGKQYEKDKGYYMQVQFENLVYKVGKSKYETIFKWVDDLPDKLPKKEEKKS